LPQDALRAWLRDRPSAAAGSPSVAAAHQSGEERHPPTPCSLPPTAPITRPAPSPAFRNLCARPYLFFPRGLHRIFARRWAGPLSPTGSMRSFAKDRVFFFPSRGIKNHHDSFARSVSAELAGDSSNDGENHKGSLKVLALSLTHEASIPSTFPCL
jgi:hypothetical protein